VAASPEWNRARLGLVPEFSTTVEKIVEKAEIQTHQSLEPRKTAVFAGGERQKPGPGAVSGVLAALDDRIGWTD
jgi:hypothetical protein